MPPVIYVPVGIHGQIRCPVDAVPPVTHVKWNKDGRPLKMDKVGNMYCGRSSPFILSYTTFGQCPLWFK